MPLSFKILQKFGTTDERLAQLFTADPSKLPTDASESEKEEKRLDWEMRKKIEDIVAYRIDDAILQSLKTSHLHAAVDLAWDSSIVTRKTIPLVMYAQRRINMDQCVNSLKELKCADQYIKYDPKSGRPKEVDLPKFSEVNINIVRSVITRRVAAQSARFTNLYPFFKFEPRGTAEEDRLRGDLLSQRMDIMADQYGYREAQVQWIRDMLLYPHVLVVPACRWHREVEWVDENQDISPDFRGEDIKVKARVRREGVPFISPHPSRVFYDISHPIQSLNSDSGCEWFGFWDVVRYATIRDNPDFFNRNEISYSPDATSWFYSYSNYFSQYYTAIQPPINQDEISSINDRKANFDKYTAGMEDSSVYLTHIYWKVRPNQWRMGNYPHPVWLHLVVANSKTIVAAEWMPDCPAAVFSYNESSQRLVNLSMAHDLLPFQDQLTNLYSQLLECAKRDLFGIAMLNLDAFPAENPEAQKALEQFRAAIRNENFYAATSILEVSLIKMRDLGVGLDSVFKVLRQEPNTALNMILSAIGQTIMLAERVMALSPQEQAQISPRETSATEVQIVATSTENIYQFISDSIDSGRSAIKRYLYNAMLALGTDEVYLPVVNRYRRSSAERIGMRVTGMNPSDSLTDSPAQFSVMGSKQNLIAEYVFNSRDGAERSSNFQSAQILTQMLGVLMQPAVLSMLTKEKLAEIINVIIRQSGAGMDVLVEPMPGEETQPVMPQQQQQQPMMPPEQAAAQEAGAMELPRQ
jgi:hypothetical protein